MSDGLGPAVGKLMEIVEAIVRVVGPNEVQASLNAHRKQREQGQVVAAENSWQERCKGGDAHAVKRLSDTSFLFARAEGDRLICGPVSSVNEPERAALIGAKVGTKVTIAGGPVVLTAAYEEGPAKLKAVGKAK